MDEELKNTHADRESDDGSEAGGLGSEIAALFQKMGLDESLPEPTGFRAERVSFKDFFK